MPTLTYFDFPGGRGEDCRIALHLAGVPFTDDRVKNADWAARKPATPFGVLPVYEEDGRVLAQSNAILTYLGRKHGLLPADEFEAARHLALLEAAEELRALVQGASPKDPDAKKAAREELKAGGVQRWCRNVGAQIRGPFVGGDTLSVADLKLFVVLRWFMNGGVDHIGPDAFADHPKVVGLYEAVKAHPGVVSWYAR